MASSKMAFILLLLLLIVKLIVCTATTVPWIYIPDTVPYGHPVLKLPCRPHLTTNYTITQYLLGVSQVQAHDFEENSANIFGPKLQEQIIESHLFSLDKDDCLVVTYADLSHWRGRDLAVTVRTFENHSTVDHNFLVRVLSQPSSIKLAFQEPEYLGYILENQRPGSFVHGLHNLRAIARSSSSLKSLSPGDITYYILSPPSARQTFSLTTLPDGEVQVFTKHALDREVASTHSFVVEAVGPRGSLTTANVRVDVLDVDDSAPVLKQKYYVTVVDEKIPVESPILRVVARDPDLINEGPTVYSMETRVPSQENSTPFRIDPSTGLVMSTMSPLPVNHHYLFKVFASDSSGHRSVSSLVKVIVKKNVPLKFQKENSEGNQQSSPPPLLYVGHDDPSYSSVIQVRRRRASPSGTKRLMENMKGNLFAITVNDPSAKFELVSDPSGWFKIDPNTGNVTLNDGQNLDYESIQSLELEFKITTSKETIIVKQQIEILDVNDEPPYFINKPKPLKAVVTKNMYNQVVYTLRAADKDSSHKIKYRKSFDESKAFELNEDTGEIKLKWEEYLQPNTSYSLTVYAEDVLSNPVQRSKSENLEIYTGELPPQFYENNYVGSVQENNQPNQFVQNLTIAVKSFQNRSISFKLKSLDAKFQRYFKIKKKPYHDAEANIIVMKAFDYNTDLHVYNLEVLAIDSPGLTSTASLSINIKDVNDHLPEFNLHTYTFTGVQEDAPNGSRITNSGSDPMKIIATDRDSGKNSRISFRVSDDNFKVETKKLHEGKYEAILTVNSKLDYEVNPILEFKIFATDDGVPKNTATAKVKVLLKNLNNKFPVFPTDEKELIFKVTETATRNTFVGNIKVQDPDGDEVCFYFGNYSAIQGPFEIDPKTGSIKTINNLDKNKPFYTLNVMVTDDGCKKNKSAHVTKGNITIVVDDVNNNKPIFTNCSRYNPSIKEGIDIDSFVIQVQASDEDRGSNGDVSYQLVSPDTPFKIDRKTGVIRTTDNLSRNKHSKYQLLVRAEDGGTPKLLDLCPFVVNIEDINDNAPEFEAEIYMHTISRNDPVGKSLLSVKAVDDDTALNAAIDYSIDSNLTYFRIDNEGNIYLDRSLDKYKDDKITFTVKAVDRGNVSKEGTTRVEFKIARNAPNPIWLNQTGTVIRVSENQTSNTPFAHFIAKSNFSDAAVSYFLMSGSTPVKLFENFKIRQKNGVMELLLDKTLDYETKKMYNLRARVTNRHYPEPLTSDLRFTINVSDANDQVPIFKKFDSTSGIFYASVYENQPVNTTVIKIIVEDKDPTENYHKIVYKLQKNAPFTIDENGVIRTSEMFDRENKTFYDIEISASDNPGGVHINTETRFIRIKINDINDNEPKFAKSFYTFDVTENTPKGTSVFKLTATDADDSSDLVYSIRGENVGIFSVDSTDGVIRVLNEKILDYEKLPNRYNFTYYVSDHINDVSVLIEAVITDKNDNSPEFNQSVYEVNNVMEEDDSITPENKKFLLQVWATDPDKARDNQITYTLESSTGGKYFEIDKDTGKIYLLHKLDRDFMSGGRDTYSFIVLARDEPGPDFLTGVARVNVRPQDINDNKPQFEGSSKGSVPEGSKRGKPVMDVIARDMDAGKNGEVRYRITKNSLDAKGNPYFMINATSGVISVAQPTLDYETVTEHKIDITATDMGNPPQSATRSYQIYVTDVNDNPPVCKKQNESVEVKEGFPKRIGFHRVLADDQDTDQNAQLTFTLVNGPGSEYFGVDTINNFQQGQVVVLKDLDYEKPNLRYFNLTIKVQDPSPTHFDYCYLSITVIDVNDNAPIFKPKYHTMSITEDLNMGSIFTFDVTDADSGKNGAVNFKIDRMSDPKRQFRVVKKLTNNAVIKADVQLYKPLDREDIREYELKVLGIDGGSEAQTGTGTLTVTVLDINDNYPIFAEDYRPQILENTPPKPDVQLIKAKDLDEPKNGPPFKFWLPCGGSCCETYTLCKKFGMTFNSNQQSGMVGSKTTFDREKQKFYYMPIVMSDSGNPSMTGTNTLTIQIGDVNDNKHGPGHKDILVYNYEGKYGGFSVGTVFCEDPDDWDNPDKTFTYKGSKFIAEYFRVQKNGDIIMTKGVPDDTYFFQTEVYDRVFGNTETCNVSIVVKQITEEVVTRSGSIRLEGITPEEFVKIGNDRSSPYDKFKKLLAKKLNTSMENVEIFSVMENEPGFTDVRYSAHGSPWYSPSITNGAVSLYRDEFKLLGLKINMVNINLCKEESCLSGGCMNDLIIGDNPVMINANETSFVGVDTKIVKKCVCGARDFSKPLKCLSNLCYNGGQCTPDKYKDPKCEGCPEGFTGPRCQKTTIGFSGNGFALFTPLEQCENSRTSLKFATLELSGLLFYDGPTVTKQANSERDFILLELIDGFPWLKIDHGTGQLTLSLNGRDATMSQILHRLNDGKWHQIDIIRKGKEVRMIVDHCMAASGKDRTPCEVSGETPGENLLLNVVEPLQLGGVFMDNNPTYPSSQFTPFKGCMKDFVHNSWIYDLYIKDNVNAKNVKEGCPQEEANCFGRCSKNSVCESSIKTSAYAKCFCNPGFRGQKCDKGTTVRDFKKDSFIEWKFKNSFFNGLNPVKNQMQVRFRTRNEEGMLFRVPSSSSSKFIQLMIVNSTACVVYDLGNYIGKQLLCLKDAPASNGQWHVLKVQRYGQEFVLTMDGGEGRFYTDSFGHRLGNNNFNAVRNHLVAGAEVTFSASGAQPTSSDLQDSCLDDIRYDNAWFPMTYPENGDSDAADVEKNRKTADDCKRDDCKVNTCTAHQECIALFGKYACNPVNVYFPRLSRHSRSPTLNVMGYASRQIRCQTGYKMENSLCIDIDECTSSPCFGNATCVNKDGDFKCVCNQLWTGTLCNMPRTLPSKSVASLTTGALVAILVSLFIMLILVLFVILLNRNRKPVDKYILEVDSDDDIRENVISYDEEGAGEEDQLAYDISRLRKAEPDYLKPTLDKPTKSHAPDGPDVGNYIDDRIKDADHDDNAPPFDSVREFVYEGSGSDAGSLSSLNTSTGSDGDNDYDALNNWGPKFAKLADMYGAGQPAED